MTYSLRRPGSTSFYVIEHFGFDGFHNRWQQATNDYIARIPVDDRFVGGRNKITGMRPERFELYSAFGETWQKTGNYGFPDTEAGKELAFQLLALVAKHNHGTKFRVARVHVDIKVEELGAMSIGCTEETAA